MLRAAYMRVTRPVGDKVYLEAFYCHLSSCGTIGTPSCSGCMPAPVVLAADLRHPDPPPPPGPVLIRGGHCCSRRADLPPQATSTTTATSAAALRVI